MAETKRTNLPVHKRKKNGASQDAYCVIMAGGQSERFWPASTRFAAKPYIPLIGGKSLIRLTIERVEKIFAPDHIFIILEKIYLPIAKKSLPEIPRGNFIVESVGRDTAPCIGLAALTVQSIDPDAIMVVLPSDHCVPDQDKFMALILDAIELSRHRKDIVTIGIKPAWPETGYGYIKAGKRLSASDGDEYYAVLRYIEKPSLIKARRYVKNENYYWNAGIFISRVSVLCDSLERDMPEMYAGLTKMRNALMKRKQADADRLFANLEKISIDYGLMEKAKNVIMMPARFAWDDIGTWKSLLRVLDRDEKGNVVRGNACVIDTVNSIVISGKTPVGVLGLTDVVIVSSKHGILVCDSSRAQDVRKIAQIISEKNKK